MIGAFGALAGSKGKITFSNVTGLAFHPVTSDLYAVHRRSGNDHQDLLFKINPVTGAFIPDALKTAVSTV